jgi:hypothetical protein
VYGGGGGGISCSYSGNGSKDSIFFFFFTLGVQDRASAIVCPAHRERDDD